MSDKSLAQQRAREALRKRTVLMREKVLELIEFEGVFVFSRKMGAVGSVRVFVGGGESAFRSGE